MQTCETIFASTNDNDIQYINYSNNHIDIGEFNKEYLIISHKSNQDFDILLDGTKLVENVDVEKYSISSNQTVYKRLQSSTNKVIKIKDTSINSLFYDLSELSLYTNSDTKYWFGNRFMMRLNAGVSSKNATIQSSNNTINCDNHGFISGNQFYFSSIITTSTISINEIYYIRNVTPNSFQVSSTSDGDIVVLDVDGTCTIPSPFIENFWEGRNDIFRLYFSYNSSYGDFTISSITDYHKWLFQVYKKSKNGTFVLPFSDWYTFKNYCTTNYSLSKQKIIEIWMTYHLKTPTTCHLLDSEINELNFIYDNDGPMSLLPIRLNLIPVNLLYTINFLQIIHSLSGAYGNVMSLDNEYDTNNVNNGAYGFLTMSATTSYSTLPDRYVNPRDYSASGGTYTIGSSDILAYQFYDPSNYTWYQLPINYKKGLHFNDILIHEIGHCIDNYYSEITNTKIPFSHTSTWCDILNITNPETWTGTKTLGSFVHPDLGVHEYPCSGYGCTNTHESFAEAFAYYCIHRNFLYDNFPMQHNAVENLIYSLTDVSPT